MPGKVSLIELLGSEKLVEVDLKGARVQVQVRADFAVAENAEVHVQFAPDRLHLFEKESGLSMRARNADK